MMEAILLLAAVSRRFRLKLDPDRPVAPFPSITLRPAGGVWMRISDR
jgi:cytochrome P450